MNVRNLLLGFILILIFVMSAKAEEAPAPFQNSGIERKLENGKVQKFDGNKYKIVRRNAKRKAPKVIVKEKRVYKKNAVKLYLGYGPNDLNRNNNTVELDSDPFLGIGYQRMLNEDFSIEAIGTTNESLIIGGGYHF